MASAKARISDCLSVDGIIGSPTITALPPPWCSPAAAFLSVIALASRTHSSVVTSGAIRTPPIAGPIATLSITTVARSPVVRSVRCTILAGPRSSVNRNGRSCNSVVIDRPPGRA